MNLKALSIAGFLIGCLAACTLSLALAQAQPPSGSGAAVRHKQAYELCRRGQWREAFKLLDSVRAERAYLSEPGVKFEVLLLASMSAFNSAQWPQGEQAVVELLKSAEGHADAKPYTDRGRMLIEEHVWQRHALAADRVVREHRQTAEEAIQTAQQRCRECEKRLEALKGSSLWIRSSDLWLAELCLHLRRFPQMRDFLAHARQAAQSAEFGLPRASRYWNLMGVYHIEQRNFDLAWLSLRQSYQMRQIEKGWGNQHERIRCEAECLNNLGAYCLRIGDYSQACGYLETSQALYDEIGLYDNRDLANTRLTAPFDTKINLAEALKRQQESEHVAGVPTERPAALLKEVLAFFDQPEKDRPASQLLVHALCLNNLAMLEYKQGSLSLAEGHLRASQTLLLRALPHDHARVAELEINLAWVKLRSDQPKVAQELFQSALEKLRADTKRGDPARASNPRIAECLGYLARAVQLQGDAAQARSLLSEALDLEEARLRQVLQEALSSREQLAIVQEARNHSEVGDWPGVFDTFLELSPVLEVPPAEQYRRVLRWKGLLARHALEPRLTGKAGELVLQREEVLRRLRELSANRAANAQIEASAIAALEQEAHDLQRRIRRLAEDVERPAAEIYDVAEVVSILPSSSAMLDVVAARRAHAAAHYVGFLVNPAGAVIRLDFGDAALFEQAIVQFYGQVQDDPRWSAEARNALLQSSAFLKQHLRDPLAQHMGDASLLILVPDGQWHTLPLAAIPAADPQAWFPQGKNPDWQRARLWAESMSFGRVLSAHSLVDRRMRKAAAEPSWLVAGGDVFPKEQGDNLTRAEEQVTFVDQQYRQRFPQAQNSWKLLKGEVQKQALKSGLGAARFAHLVMHGKFESQGTPKGQLLDLSAQLDSALILPVATPQPLTVEQRITADEIRGLRLEKLDLLVLSACQTGLGHAQQGQGMVGLLGALDQAGARTVANALWEVSESQTFDLLKEFYKRWLGDTPINAADALREAQCSLLKNSNFQSPYFWAGFQLMGDPALMAPKPAAKAGLNAGSR